MDIWKILLEYGLSFLLMGLGVFYFLRKEKDLLNRLENIRKLHSAEMAKKDEELKSLNEQIRVDNKDTIKTLVKLELVLDKVIDSQKSTNKDIVVSIKEHTMDLKQHISTKIKEINND